MKIGYRKCFNLGNYENEVIFIEGDVPDEDDFAPVFENMKNAVENLHRRSLEIDTERSESEKEEEEREFGEACRPLVLRGSATEKEREHIIDELGDVEIVLMHIASLLGTSPGECIRRSFEKIEETPELLEGVKA